MTDFTQPRSVRTFNPGAMNYGPFAQRFGATGTDGRLAVFPDMQTGFNAMSGLLDVYRDKHGLDSVHGIINRWAPPGVDNNSTNNYVATVARKLGIDPTAPVPPHMRAQLMEAMAGYEAGRPVTMGGAPPQPNTPAAASPRGPQPMADPYQPQQPEQSPFNSFLDRLQGPLTQQGLGLLMASMQGKDLNEGMNAGMARGNQFLQQQQQRQLQAQEQAKRQAISQMLADPSSMQGVPPALVNLARATQNVDPVAQFMVKQASGGGTDDIKEYEYAVKSGFKGGFQEWMAQKKQHGGDYSKVLVYGEDDKGNVVPMQPGSRGDLIASKMPPGVRIQRDPIKIDGPTGTVLIDPTTRTQIGFIPKQIAQAEIDKSTGEQIAKARASLPMAEQTFKNAQEMLNKIRSHEALVKGYGVGVGSYIPAIHGTSVKDFDALVEQAKGGAFLQAAQNMRGLGALTETEGRAATQAVTRMNRALTKEAFLEALKDYENIMERGLAVTRAQAQIGQQPAGAPPPGVQQVPNAPQAVPVAPPQAPAGNGGWSMQKVQ